MYNRLIRCAEAASTHHTSSGPLAKIVRARFSHDQADGMDAHEPADECEHVQTEASQNSLEKWEDLQKELATFIDSLMDFGRTLLDEMQTSEGLEDIVDKFCDGVGMIIEAHAQLLVSPFLNKELAGSGGTGHGLQHGQNLDLAAPCADGIECQPNCEQQRPDPAPSGCCQ